MVNTIRAAGMALVTVQDAPLVAVDHTYQLDAQLFKIHSVLAVGRVQAVSISLDVVAQLQAAVLHVVRVQATSTSLDALAYQQVLA